MKRRQAMRYRSFKTMHERQERYRKIAIRPPRF